MQVLGRDMGISLDMGGWMLAGALALVLGGGCLWFRHEAREAQRARLSGRVRRGGRRLRCRKWNLPGVRRKTLWRSGGRRWSVLSGSRPGCGRRYGRRNAIMRRCVCGTALLCLCLCAACSRRVEVPVPLLLRTEVPAHLLEATPEPIFQGTSNGDLLEWALENRDALRRCNADKRAIERAGER